MSRTAAGLSLCIVISQHALADDPPGTRGAGGLGPRSTATALGLSVGTARPGGLPTVGGGLPIGPAFPLDRGRPFSLNADFPPAEEAGADSDRSGPDGGYGLRLNRRWYLTPSADRAEASASGGTMASGALTSRFLIFGGRYTLWMGNAINYSPASDPSARGDSSGAISHAALNTAFVNGLVLSRSLDAMGRGYVVEYSITDTRYAGTELYNDRYDEIGVAVGRSGSAGLGMRWRAGLSYLSAPRSQGVAINVSYTF